MRVRTKYVPATDTAGSKIRVNVIHDDRPRQVTIGYPHESSDAHLTAVRALVGPDAQVTMLRDSVGGHIYEVTYPD